MIGIFKKKEEKKIEAVPEKTQPFWTPMADYEEGQLSLDVYETDKSIVVKSTIAGVNPDDLDITIDNDMLTIRGKRHDESKGESRQYLYKECYWGAFSRSVILPMEVDPKKIDAALENGVLTVTLKKVKKSNKVGIKVKG
jgi:HSP20 family protein